MKLLSLHVKLEAITIVVFGDTAKTEYQNPRTFISSLTILHLEEITE